MLCRNLSHKKTGSKRSERARKALVRVYKHSANQRRDFHYKTARSICNDYAVICLETLNISGMKKLWGKKIYDLGFYSFVQVLKYEAQKFGTKIVEIDRFYPSSQICSECRHKNAEVKDLRIRRGTCPQCGAEHDQDRNAAKNILRAGVSAHAGEPVRHPVTEAQVC